MATTTTQTAPELTQEQVQRLLVTPLTAASIFLASGVRIFDVTHSGRVRIPRLTGMTSPAWHGEGEAITEVSPDFDDVVLLDGVASLKAIVRYSNEMARSSIVALDAALRDKLVTDVAAMLDGAFFAGDGAVAANGLRAPIGIINYPGAQVISGVGSLSLDDILDAIGVLLATNVDPSRCRIFMRSSVFIAVRKMKDTTGRPLLVPDVTQDGVYRIHGLQVVVTNRLPEVGGASTVVVADMGQVAVARDMAPSVTVLRERYADTDEQALRVVARYDAAPLNPDAVVLLEGATD